MPTIVLADDHHVVRQGLRALLDAEKDFKVIGEAADGLQVVPLVEKLVPDVLVIDLKMPGLSGIEATRQVRKRSPKTAIVVLSMHSNEAYVLEALQAGAKGYVLKESSAEELVRAVHEAAVGHRYLSTTLSERAIDAYLAKSQTEISDPYETLTTREREVLHLVAQGSTNADIADRLVISRRTVEIHRTNMMRKLNLHTQTELLRYTINRGIVPEEK